MKSQNADFGILITLKRATQGMITKGVKDGYAESVKKIPKIQLLTVGTDLTTVSETRV